MKKEFVFIFLFVGFFVLGGLSGIFFEIKRNEEKTQRDEFDTELRVMSESFKRETKDARIFADCLYGGIGRRAISHVFESRIAWWIYAGLVRATEDMYGLDASIFDGYEDIVASYLSSAKSDATLFRFPLDERKAKLLNEVREKGEKVLASREMEPEHKCPKTPDGVVHVCFQKTYETDFVKNGRFRFSYERKFIPQAERFWLRDDIDNSNPSEWEIEEALYFQYLIRGRSEARDDGSYSLFFILKDLGKMELAKNGSTHNLPKEFETSNEIAVCPMDAEGFLCGKIQIKKFKEIKISANGTWQVLFE